MDVVAMGTSEFQRQLPILAETLHVHLETGGRLSARIRTGKEEACHSDLLRFLKKEVDTGTSGTPIATRKMMVFAIVMPNGHRLANGSSALPSRYGLM